MKVSLGVTRVGSGMKTFEEYLMVDVLDIDAGKKTEMVLTCWNENDAEVGATRKETKKRLKRKFMDVVQIMKMVGGSKEDLPNRIRLR